MAESAPASPLSGIPLQLEALHGAIVDLASAVEAVESRLDTLLTAAPPDVPCIVGGAPPPNSDLGAFLATATDSILARVAGLRSLVERIDL